MLYIPQKKTLFVAVPKTGSDYVTDTLNHSAIPTRIPRMKGRGGKHAPWWMVDENVQYSFAFVREPVSWYKSFYAFILDHYIKPFGSYPVFESGLWHPQRRFERYDFSSFDKFITDVYSDNPAYYTRMVEWMLGPEDTRPVNYIGKQENLNRDFAFVLDHLGYTNVANAVRMDKKKVNTSRSDKVDVSDKIHHLIVSEEIAFYRRFNYPTQGEV